jgi:hypothetical protein
MASLTTGRVRKYVRRNRPQVTAVSLIMLALIVGIVGTTLGLIEAQSQNAEAKRQESLALGEAEENARRAEAEQRVA